MLRQTLTSVVLSLGLCGAASAQDLPVPGTAYFELHAAHDQMGLNMKQFEALLTFQKTLMSGADETLLNRNVPEGLCLEGMDAICALFPATFGTWGQGGE
jgi:hypothetical protein